MRKNKQKKCPVCKCWFVPEAKNETYCSTECRDEQRHEYQARYWQIKREIFDVLIRKACFFAFLNACEGKNKLTMREGNLYEVYDREGLSQMTKNQVATVIEQEGKHLVLCSKHFQMVKTYLAAHPRENFDHAYLHVLDRETGKLEVD